MWIQVEMFHQSKVSISTPGLPGKSGKPATLNIKRKKALISYRPGLNFTEKIRNFPFDFSGNYIRFSWNWVNNYSFLYMLKKTLEQNHFSLQGWVPLPVTCFLIILLIQILMKPIGVFEVNGSESTISRQMKFNADKNEEIHIGRNN